MNQTPPETKKRLRFKNPPIVEAVIALNVAILPEEMIDAFDDSVEAMSHSGYGRVEPIWQHQLEVKFENGISSSGGGSAFRLGVKFKSDDELHAVQFNRTGVVFSRLGSYESWEQFRDEATKLWAVYSSITGSPQIISIGVRYINKLFIPLGRLAEDYVTVWPHLPEGIDQTIEGMSMRLDLPIKSPEGRLVHTQMLLPPEMEGFSVLLLDNDFQFETSQIKNEEVWQLLDTVRDIKDHYFEKFTTEKMRESFDA